MAMPVLDRCWRSRQAGANMPEAQRELVLLRQTLLTAHELGHVMGFEHNFAASLNNSRVGDGIPDAAREGDAGATSI